MATLREWEQEMERREEAAVLEASGTGRLPLVDLVEDPMPRDVLAALALRRNPDAREAAYRKAQGLRLRAASWRSLALVLEQKGKASRAESLRAKADAAEVEANEVEAPFVS